MRRCLTTGWRWISSGLPGPPTIIRVALRRLPTSQREEFFSTTDHSATGTYTIEGRQLFIGGPPDSTEGQTVRIDYYGEVPVFSDTQPSWSFTPNIRHCTDTLRADARRSARDWRRTNVFDAETIVRGHDHQAQRQLALCARVGFAAVAHTGPGALADGGALFRRRNGGPRAVNDDRLRVAAHRRSWCERDERSFGPVAYARQGGRFAFHRDGQRADGGSGAAPSSVFRRRPRPGA